MQKRYLPIIRSTRLFAKNYFAKLHANVPFIDRAGRLGASVDSLFGPWGDLGLEAARWQD